MEPGAHSIAVTLNGIPLPGCPFLVKVRDPYGEELQEMASGAPKGQKFVASAAGKAQAGRGAKVGRCRLTLSNTS